VWLGQRGTTTGRLLDRNTADTIGSYARIWLVVPGNPTDPLTALTAAERASLTSEFHISERHDYEKLTLTLLPA
jgi:hypothetical protein